MEALFEVYIPYENFNDIKVGSETIGWRGRIPMERGYMGKPLEESGYVIMRYKFQDA